MEQITHEEAAREVMRVRAEILKLEEDLGQLHKRMRDAGMEQIEQFPKFMPHIGEVIPALYRLATHLVGMKKTDSMRSMKWNR